MKKPYCTGKPMKKSLFIYCRLSVTDCGHKPLVTIFKNESAFCSSSKNQSELVSLVPFPVIGVTIVWGHCEQ